MPGSTRSRVEDGAATLTALTAASIAAAIRAGAPQGSRVLVSGGGTRNRAIMQALEKRLEGFTVERSDAMNLHADAKEAIAFAVLGYETASGPRRERTAGNGRRAPGRTRGDCPVRVICTHEQGAVRMPRVVVGVDAGGTSTLAALAADGALIRTRDRSSRQSQFARYRRQRAT